MISILTWLIYVIIAIIYVLVLNAVAPQIYAFGEPHSLENVDPLGFKVLLITYLIVWILTLYLGLKTYDTVKVLGDPLLKKALTHLGNTYTATSLSHAFEFLGALYLILVGRGDVPVKLGGLELHLYIILVVLGYMMVVVTSLELMFFLSYVKWEGLSKLTYLEIAIAAGALILMPHPYNMWGLATWEAEVPRLALITALLIFTATLLPVVLATLYYHSKYKETFDENLRAQRRAIRDGFLLILLSIALVPVYKAFYRPYSIVIVSAEILLVTGLFLTFLPLVLRKTPRDFINYLKKKLV